VEDKVTPFDINRLDDAVEEGDTDGMRDWFTALFAILPYPADKRKLFKIGVNFSTKERNIVEWQIAQGL
jgi:hypothetical protein